MGPSPALSTGTRLADAKSAATLQAALKDKDREVRIAAAVGLANIGQVNAADELLKMADTAQGWERTQANKACLVMAERLAAAGKKQDAKDNPVALRHHQYRCK